jgi:hypothetical protein
MAQAPDKTRREIEKTRLRITEAIDELEKRAEKSKDLRLQAKNYPLEMILAAFLASFSATLLFAGLIFSLFPSRGKVGHRASEKATRPGFSFSAIFRLIRPIIARVSVAAIVTYIRRGGKTGTSGENNIRA